MLLSLEPRPQELSTFLCPHPSSHYSMHMHAVEYKLVLILLAMGRAKNSGIFTPPTGD
jgi:hypothetical protein